MISREYLAGLFDGEGCIGIYKVKRSCRPEPEHIMQVVLASTFKPVLEQITIIHGGNLRVVNTDCWRLTWSSTKAATILNYMLPCLIIKREQALLALEYQQLVDELGRTMDTFDDREELCRQIKALKYERWTR